MHQPILVFHPNGTLTVDNGETTITYRYADFSERFLARLIDIFIVLIPGSILPILGPWLYFAIMQSTSDSATVGQRAMNIKLLSDDGLPVSFAQATGRHFANWLSAFILCIGYFMFFFSDRKQCLHDLLGGTYVVRQVSITSSTSGIDQIGIPNH